MDPLSLIIGIFIGANFGILIFALLRMASSE
jgi:hypothetical protein